MVKTSGKQVVSGRLRVRNTGKDPKDNGMLPSKTNSVNIMQAFRNAGFETLLKVAKMDGL